MKTFVFALLVLSSSIGSAVEPVTVNSVLGVSSGIYEGGGTLHSKTFGVPSLHYNSVRKISGNIIEAKTKASLLGITVAEAAARLKVIPTGAGKFQMIDIDSGKPAGGGQCKSNSCSFSATVMNGKLTLNETWIADESGFTIVNGSQVFDKKAATYEGRLQLHDF